MVSKLPHPRRINVVEVVLAEWRAPDSDALESCRASIDVGTAVARFLAIVRRDERLLVPTFRGLPINSLYRGCFPYDHHDAAVVRNGDQHEVPVPGTMVWPAFRRGKLDCSSRSGSFGGSATVLEGQSYSRLESMPKHPNIDLLAAEPSQSDHGDGGFDSLHCAGCAASG